jgi:multicomponent K+:H+ antiporter subunit G
MNEVMEIVIAALIVIGGIFTLVGGYGLVKLNNAMSRMHAPTKASTLGVGSILAASMLYAVAKGGGSVHEVLIILFLFVTAPVSAHFIAKVAIHKRDTVPENLPACGEDDEWATYAKDLGADAAIAEEAKKP